MPFAFYRMSNFAFDVLLPFYCTIVAGHWRCEINIR
jgi:hypothetical protein